MAKEYCWDISIDGESHQVCCELSNNKYILYLDEEHLTNVYRDFPRKMHFGLEAEIEIRGKKCLFVVWDETPDLVVDGVMQGKKIDYEQAREKRKQSSCKAFRILFWVALLWTCAVSLLTVVHILTAEQCFRFVWVGILLMIAGASFRRKWERW